MLVKILIGLGAILVIVLILAALKSPDFRVTGRSPSTRRHLRFSHK